MILGSQGRLEASVPYTDDERRDFEVHLKKEFGRGLAVQVKCASSLVKGALVVHFVVSKKRLVNDPRFWYFFAYLDLIPMDFRDPVFLVPSTVVHAHGRRVASGRMVFTLNLSLAAGSHDQWSSYRLRRVDLGTRIVEIIKGLPLRTAGMAARGAPAAITSLPEVVFVARPPVR